MQISNAIAWGHMQLKGGWKGILMLAAVWFAVSGGLVLAGIRIDPTSSRQTLAFCIMFLMGLQIGALLLFPCYTISAAVRKDVSSKMIESHRLMPVSGTDAVFGYVLGPACQAIALSLVNLLLGLILCPWGGIAPMAWLKANFVLGVFALCSWVAVVFLPLAMPFGSRVLMGLVWVLVVGYQAIPPLVPGLSILAGPALGGSVFSIILTGELTAAHGISMLAQVAVVALCFVGAVRKYRRDDVLGWGPVTGLIALAVYMALCVTGISCWELLKPRFLHMERIPFAAQLLVAAVSALLAGIIPVAAAAWLQAGYEFRRALHDPAPNPRPVPMFLVALAAALIAAVLLPWTVTAHTYVAAYLAVLSGGPNIQPAIVAPVIPKDLMIRTIAVAAAFLLSVGYVLRIMYRRALRPRWGIAFLFVALTWAGPPMLDFLVNGAMQGFETDSIFTAISGCSPPVALIYLWGGVGPIPTTPGIAFQLLLAAAAAIAFYATKRPVPAGDLATIG